VGPRKRQTLKFVRAAHITALGGWRGWFIVIGLPIEGEIDQSFKIAMNVGGKRVNVLRKFFSRKRDAEQITHIDKLESEIATLSQLHA
jgi:hypothetical protein